MHQAVEKLLTLACLLAKPYVKLGTFLVGSSHYDYDSTKYLVETIRLKG